MPAPSYNIVRDCINSSRESVENGTIINTSYATTVEDRASQTISSVKTANWRTMPKRQRMLVINNYGKTHLHWSDPRGSLRVNRVWTNPSTPAYYGRSTYIDYTLNYWCASGGFPADPGWRGGDLTQKVNSSLLSQLNEGKSQTLVSLAEAHKTAAMVGSSATRIVEAIRAARSFNYARFTRALGIPSTTKGSTRWARHARNTGKGKRGSFRDAEDFAAQTWLEYSYGWKPLLSDVYSHASALARHLVERQNVVRRVKAKTSATDRYTTSLIAGVLWRNSYSREWKRKVETGIFYRIDDSILGAANNFGLTNPALVAWELVPFSFVADWFIPIGNALENLTSTQGLSFHSGYLSQMDEVHQKGVFSGTGISYYDGSRTAVAMGTVTREDQTFSLTRTRLLSFPSPQFPNFKDPRSISHGISAISLLQSLFLKQR